MNSFAAFSVRAREQHARVIRQIIPGLAIRKEIERAGYVIVPMEPTEAMLRAYLNADGTIRGGWRAMIEAFQAESASGQPQTQEVPNENEI